MPPTPAFSTTTVTLTPTLSAAAQSPDANAAHKTDTMPLGAIVGSVAGGVLLALVCFLGWMAWRKTMLHQRAKEKAASLTRQNTLRNSCDKLRSYSPPAWTPGPATSTKVKFATPEKEIDGDIPPSTDNNAGKIKMEFKLKKGDNGPGGKASVTPSRPKALKAPRSLNRHPSELGDVKFPIPPPPPVSLPSRLPRHKASTVSSGSYYSLESGEEYPARPARLHSVVSALGNLSETRSSMPISNRVSVSSSMWSFLSRTSRGGRLPSSRLSQATSISAYSQPEEPIVGVAY